MAIYKNFTGNTTDTTLVRKHIDKLTISTVHIACTHDTAALTVDRLYIDNGTEYDIIANVEVPVGSALQLDIPHYNYRTFDLKITTTGSSNCTIILK